MERIPKIEEPVLNFGGRQGALRHLHTLPVTASWRCWSSLVLRLRVADPLAHARPHLGLRRAARRPGTAGIRPVGPEPARGVRALGVDSVTDEQAGDGSAVIGSPRIITPMTEGRYLLDNRQAEAGRRFDALAALFNPSTFGRALSLGLGPGWRVWEVGAGGPSVPRWLAEKVGPEGLVLATDIDTSWIESAAPGYLVQRHDVGTDPVPGGPFDLVHARLVLVHVSERSQALATMIEALRPGGWLLVEEADPELQPLVCIDEWGPEQELANKLKAGFRALLSGRGVDLAYGRTLPRLLREAGLLEVKSEAYFPVGGPACNELETATVEQVREQLTSAGLATSGEIDRHLAAVSSGRLDLATSPMISSWGRRAAKTSW